MTNYFGRKVLRIKNLRDELSEVLCENIAQFLQLEKVSKDGNAVCAYIPHQLKQLVEKRMLTILNSHQNAKRYSSKDIEMKSTIVLITNVPILVTDEEMDSILSEFGETLTKFQQMKWKNKPLVEYPMKLGWIVFEYIRSAEMCEENLPKVMLCGSYLEAMILPADITTESPLLELCTLQIEGFPANLCTEEKIRELLMAGSPEALRTVKFVQTKVQLHEQGKWRYLALLDWATSSLAMKFLKVFDGMKYYKNDEFVAVLNASLTLPGQSAFTDYCQRINRYSELQKADNTMNQSSLPLDPPSYEESEILHRTQRNSAGYLPNSQCSLLGANPDVSTHCNNRMRPQRSPPNVAPHYPLTAMNSTYLNNVNPPMYQPEVMHPQRMPLPLMMAQGLPNSGIMLNNMNPFQHQVSPHPQYVQQLSVQNISYQQQNFSPQIRMQHRNVNDERAIIARRNGSRRPQKANSPLLHTVPTVSGVATSYFSRSQEVSIADFRNLRAETIIDGNCGITQRVFASAGQTATNTEINTQPASARHTVTNTEIGSQPVPASALHTVTNTEISSQPAPASTRHTIKDTEISSQPAPVSARHTVKNTEISSQPSPASACCTVMNTDISTQPAPTGPRHTVINTEISSTRGEIVPNEVDNLTGLHHLNVVNLNDNSVAQKEVTDDKTRSEASLQHLTSSTISEDISQASTAKTDDERPSFTNIDKKVTAGEAVCDRKPKTTKDDSQELLSAISENINETDSLQVVVSVNENLDVREEELSSPIGYSLESSRCTESEKHDSIVNGEVVVNKTEDATEICQTISCVDDSKACEETIPNIAHDGDNIFNGGDKTDSSPPQEPKWDMITSPEMVEKYLMSTTNVDIEQQKGVENILCLEADCRNDTVKILGQSKLDQSKSYETDDFKLYHGTPQEECNNANLKWNQKKSSKRWSVTKKARSNNKPSQLNQLFDDILTECKSQRSGLTKTLTTTENINIADKNQISLEMGIDKCISVTPTKGEKLSRNLGKEIVTNEIVTDILSNSFVRSAIENTSLDQNRISSLHNQNTKADSKGKSKSSLDMERIFNSSSSNSPDILQSLLQMTLMDCQLSSTGTTLTSSSSELVEVIATNKADSTTSERSRLLSFFDNNGKNMRPKAFPCKQFSQLF